MERCKQRRAARAASLAASRAGDLAVSSESPTAAESPTAESPSAESLSGDRFDNGSQLSMRESVSSLSDSQDGDMGAIDQQSVGNVFFLAITQKQHAALLRQHARKMKQCVRYSDVVITPLTVHLHQHMFMCSVRHKLLVLQTGNCVLSVLCLSSACRPPCQSYV